MKSQRSVNKALIPVVAILLLAGVALLGLGFRSGATQVSREMEIPQVKNFVSGALKIEKIEKGTHSFVIFVRNISGKDIMAYSYSRGPFFESLDGMLRVGTLDMVAIAKDGVEEIDAGLRQFSLRPKEEAILNLNAVVFADQSFAGSPEVAIALKDRAYGSTIQAKRIQHLVKKALEAPDAELEKSVRDLESQISALPDASGPGISRMMASGLRSEKEIVKYFLSVYREDVSASEPKSPRAALQEVLKNIEEELGKYKSDREPIKR